MKTLIKTLSVLTLATSIGNLGNVVLNTTSQKSNIKTNFNEIKTQQATIYIDKDGKQVVTNEINLSKVDSKEVIQIGFYQNEQGKIQTVIMPKNVEKVPDQLPPKITSLSFMFINAISFNQDLSNWDVSSVEVMTGMFAGAKAFNQDLSKWDVSKVEAMAGMFAGAAAFNQDLSKWNVAHVIDHTGFAIGSGITNFNKLPKFNK